MLDIGTKTSPGLYRIGMWNSRGDNAGWLSHSEGEGRNEQVISKPA
jgi:hypothetical protein